MLNNVSLNQHDDAFLLEQAYFVSKCKFRPNAIIKLMPECRDLAESSLEYCTAFGNNGAVEPLVGLLDDADKTITVMAAQALGCLVASEPCCNQIRSVNNLKYLCCSQSALLQYRCTCHPICSHSRAACCLKRQVAVSCLACQSDH